MWQQLSDDLFVIVRPASGSGAALAGMVRTAIGRIDKAQLVSVRDVLTLDDVAWRAASRHRFRAVLVAALASLALALAMVGVFGTFAYDVQQRLREFGLRIALGASASSVFAMVMRGAARTVGAGVVVGLALASGSAQLISSMLFGVEPLDAATLCVVPVVLAATAFVSIAPPAWRATRVDPARTLRAD
jgi:putative ABC transport system permease protein